MTVTSIYKVGNMSIKLLQGSTPIIKPTLVQHPPVCSQLFAWLYLVLTIVIRLWKVYTSRGTCPLNYYRGVPV